MFHEKLEKDGDPFYKRLLGGEAASVASGDQIIFLLKLRLKFYNCTKKYRAGTVDLHVGAVDLANSYV